MTTVKPLPQDAASGKQIEAIHKMVCHQGKYKQWWVTPYSETAAYLNGRFGLELNEYLEPLTKAQASNLIDQLKQ